MEATDIKEKITVVIGDEPPQEVELRDTSESRKSFAMRASVRLMDGLGAIYSGGSEVALRSLNCCSILCYWNCFGWFTAPKNVEIEIKVAHVRQLFNTMDPSPFYHQDIDKDAED